MLAPVSGLRGSASYGEAGSNAGEGKAKSGMRIRGSVARRAVLRRALHAADRCGVVVGHQLMARTRSARPARFPCSTSTPKKTITVTFKRDGKYDDDALKQLNTFMRDWRDNQETKMDPELIDLIWTLHKSSGPTCRSISSAATARRDQRIAAAARAAARRRTSQHILGKAADITFPDVPVKVLRNSALVQEWGGVGYYPTSGVPFVHVDTGNVRMWPRIPRLELAALFPSGTNEIPAERRQADHHGRL